MKLLCLSLGTKSWRRHTAAALALSALVAGVSPFAIARSGRPVQEKRPIRTDSGNDLSPEVVDQINSLVEEKESRTPAEQKMDSRLVYMCRMHAGRAVASHVATLRIDVPRDEKIANNLIVEITTSGDAVAFKQFLHRLEDSGVEVRNIVPAYRSIQASVSMDDLETIAADSAVASIRPREEPLVQRMPAPLPGSPPSPAERRARVRTMLASALTKVAQDKHDPGPYFVGSQQSEGDTTHRASLLRNTFGADGTGIKVGVLSDGVSRLSTSQAPAISVPVTVLPGQAGTGDEGTAMLEIVHDLAPGAQLYFATADNSITSFAQNIRDLRSAGCDIIVDDVIYFVEYAASRTARPSCTRRPPTAASSRRRSTTSPPRARCTSRRRATRQRQRRNLRSIWEGDFVDGGSDPHIPGGNVPPFWRREPERSRHGESRPRESPVVRSARRLVQRLRPVRAQHGGNRGHHFVDEHPKRRQDPHEEVGSALCRRSAGRFQGDGRAGRFLHVNDFGVEISIATIGQTHGHAAAAIAYCVAATPAVCALRDAPGPFPNSFTASNKAETFKSDGPRRIL